MTDIIVIGSGVSGLSSALQSQQAGFKVSIITCDRPQHTTSMAAGALLVGRRSADILARCSQIKPSAAAGANPAAALVSLQASASPYFDRDMNRGNAV